MLKSLWDATWGTTPLWVSITASTMIVTAGWTWWRWGETTVMGEVVEVTIGLVAWAGIAVCAWALFFR